MKAKVVSVFVFRRSKGVVCFCFQKEAAASIHLSQYAIKGSEKDWTEALSGDTGKTSVISVKGSVISDTVSGYRYGY